jgi:hypothetical protein
MSPNQLRQMAKPYPRGSRGLQKFTSAHVYDSRMGLVNSIPWQWIQQIHGFARLQSPIPQATINAYSTWTNLNPKQLFGFMYCPCICFSARQGTAPCCHRRTPPRVSGSNSRGDMGVSAHDIGGRDPRVQRYVPALMEFPRTDPWFHCLNEAHIVGGHISAWWREMERLE